MVKTRRLFWTWGEAQAKTQDKVEWRRLIAALCPRRDEEVEQVSY